MVGQAALAHRAKRNKGNGAHVAHICTNTGRITSEFDVCLLVDRRESCIYKHRLAQQRDRPCVTQMKRFTAT